MSSPLEDEYVLLGKAVRFFREYAGLTQEEVAERSESALHATWISRLEKGKVNPTQSTMENVAEGIGISPSRIVSLAEAFAELSKS